MKGRRKRGAAVTALAVLLALAGLAVLLYPTLSDMVARHRVQEEIEGYNRVLAAARADYSALWVAADEYNDAVARETGTLTSDTDDLGDVEELLNPGDSNMLGYIEIPSIDVELPIYRGTDEKQLQSGVGWWVGSSLPTGKSDTHCVITGHTGLAKARLFTDLDQLEEGDRFTITVLDRTMTYEVDQVLVTDPSDVEPLEIVPGKSYVTLYTCTPYGVNDHRLLVRGRCVGFGPAGDASAAALGVSGGSWTRWAPLALIPIVAGGAALLVHSRRNRCYRGAHAARR